MNAQHLRILANQTRYAGWQSLDIQFSSVNTLVQTLSYPCTKRTSCINRFGTASETPIKWTVSAHIHKWRAFNYHDLALKCYENCHISYAHYQEPSRISTNLKVAVAGGTGQLGPSIVKALLDANFQVTLLSRTSSHEVDPRVRIQAVDYTSLDSLTAALASQDAFVNVLNSGSIPGDIHLRLIEAAHRSGVSRFIPSEFGCDTSHPLTSKLPVFSEKVAVLQKLKQVAAEDASFTYTPIITGVFLDWALEKNLIVNLTGPSTVIYNSGDSRFSSTTLAGIGQAVVGTLQHLEGTKNRTVYVSQADIAQNEVIGLSGKSDELQRIFVQTADLEKQAYEALNKTPPDGPTFAVNLVRRAIFDPDYGTLFARVDNELLGVPVLTERQVSELVKRNL